MIFYLGSTIPPKLSQRNQTVQLFYVFDDVHIAIEYGLAHSNPHRRTTLFMPAVREEFHVQFSAQQSPVARPRHYAPARLHLMRQILQSPARFESASIDPYGRETARLSRLWQGFSSCCQFLRPSQNPPQSCRERGQQVAGCCCR